MDKNAANYFPPGNVIYCEITYLIEYHNKPEYKKETKTLQAPYLTGIPDPHSGLAVAISAAQSARETIWGSWKEFRYSLEDKKEIERLMIKHTEYWTNREKDRLKVTAFIDKHVRSIPGFSPVPGNF
jgi:hypothetical protein